jgi:RNA 3'-terminal phosphate cyclase
LTKQGELVSIKGVSHASKALENAKVAERQANAAKQALLQLKVPIEITSEYSAALSAGSGITLWAIFSANKEEVDAENPIRLGADALGEKGKPAEQVGQEAARQLLAEIECKTPVDSHLADNLIPLMSLCKPSTIKTSRITSHTKTNMQAAEAFLGKTFKLEDSTIKSE